MANSAIEKYIQHPKRNWITGATTLMVFLLMVVPTWDDLNEIRTECIQLESELVEKTRTLANRELMQTRVKQIQGQSGSTHQMIDSEKAERIREAVTQFVRRFNCQMSRLTVSEPRVRPWSENDNPLSHSPPANGIATKFQLETRDMNLSVTGKLRELGELIVALNGLDAFSVPTEMTLQRENDDGQLRLNVHVSLFNLAEIHD